MDGRVLADIFVEVGEIVYSEDGAEASHLTDQQTLSEEESAQVEERLRSLGYL